MTSQPNAAFFPENETLRLSADGTWYSDGIEITHPGTLDLFGRSLHRKPGDRGYELRVGRETKDVDVEDTAVFVKSVDRAGRDDYKLTLTDGTERALSAENLKFKPPSRLTVMLREAKIGEGPIEEARFVRSAYHDFLKNLQEDAEGYFVVVSGIKARLQRISIKP